MYKKILAAVNEHINSEVAARYALRLAKQLEAELFFCFVAEESMPQHTRCTAEDAVNRLYTEALDLNIRAERISILGDPVAEIGKIVRHEKIGLVFAATRREDIERRFYSGTVARSLSLKLPCSVALVRVVHMGKIHPSKILVPLKARVNKVKERAYFTAKMAEAFGGKIIVFHATKPITRFFHGEIHLTPVEWEKRLPKDISDFNAYIRKSDIELEGLLLPGHTSKGITIEAAAKRHDLIIMGASERPLFTFVLKGSPVEAVLRETPCDLIILNPRHEDK
ncbi:MAG: universal stress protein [Nitrospirota bacterium]|nr:universal stress protein [Nitrospirota bacterium]